MKKKFRKPSAILSLILSVLMIMSVCPLMASAQYAVEYYYPEGTTFVSAIAFARSGYWGIVNLNSTKEKLTDAGYSALDWDFNDGCGTNSDWIAGGWKNSTNVADAIRDIKFRVADDGGAPQSYNLTVNGRTVTYYLVGGTYEPNSVKDGGVIDLNGNAGGKYIHAYITRDPNAGPPITGIYFNDQSSRSGCITCTKLNATGTKAELNEGAGGSDLYMHYSHNSTQVSTSALQSVYPYAVNMVPNKINYTSDTYRALETAYNNAKPIVEKFNQYGAASITQASINTAYNDLYSAVYNAETNLYFNASNNGGTTAAKSTTVKIGPNSTYNFNVSSYTATKGNWNFLGWNTNKDATTGSKTTVNVGFNNTLYAIFGKDVTTTFKYLQNDGTVKTEAGAGTIYNTAIAADVTAPSVNNVTYNDDALTFVGWRDDASADKAEFTGTVPVKDGITYVFRAVYSAPVTVTFDNNGRGSAAPAAITNVKYYNADDTVVEGSADFVIPSDVLTETGWGFIGWSEDKNATEADYAPGAALTGIKEDTTLYAVWSQNSYPVVFRNYDGEELQNTDVLYGEMPEYKGETPVKEGTIDTKWVFDGWDKEFTAVTGAQEYVAQFHSETADYLVQFVNDDGTVLYEEMVDYLGMPEYKGETPEKAKDAQFTYTFAGWDNEFTQVEGAQIYTATYSTTLNSYLVQFVNYNGDVLQEETLDYGTVPTYKGETPVRDEDAQYIYTFDKWDKNIAAVTGEAVYTAVYKTQTKSYEITFENYDGTVLYKVTVEYGKTPEYKGEEPKKPEDVSYRYKFIGWDSEITSVTGEATYTAEFQAETKQIIVTFFNWDGNVLESKFVDYGSIAEYKGETPERKASAQYSYTFTGWDKALEPITERTEYRAQFEATVNEYTVKFVNYDGTVLQEEVLPYGSEVQYKEADPVKPTDTHVYTFNGWNKKISSVTGDATYTAVYSKVSAAYTIKFLDEDGTVLQEKFYGYGDTPVYEGETPAKAYDSAYHYEFKGWNKEIAKVDANTVYVAVYEAAAHDCGEGNVIAAPDCTKDGVVEFSCACGYSYTSVIPAHGHDYEYVIEGEKVYKVCLICGEKTEVTGEEAEEVLGNKAEADKYCKYCGKYHYKYIFPDLGFISCLISRIFTFFAELFAGNAL